MPILSSSAFMMAFQVPEEFRAWVDVAESLSREKFAVRAQTIDREARFPFENYEDLRDSGLLALTVPREHGGIGADSLTYAVILSRVAKGCASTGLTFNMHCAIVDFLLQLASPDQQQRFFKAVVDDGAIFASITTEPGSSFRDKLAIRTSIRRENGRYRLKAPNTSAHFPPAPPTTSPGACWTAPRTSPTGSSTC